ncbi:MAG: hypothetical protein D6737_10255 [Chloroflexi bacterium]|nr:MAG: hypothetical protein D6737_10255 [Chloroflexota bacterium]
MDVFDAIRSKRAVRKYTDDPLPREVITQILQAGRRAQSSKNTQPWQFIVVSDRETLEQLGTTGDYLGHVPSAALCIVLAMPTDGHQGWKMFDLGQAASYMQLAAEALGVGSCIGAIHRPDAARALLNIPATHTALALISFGYPHPDDERSAIVTQGRKSLDDITHWETW